jgi:hypothetical protein
MSKNVLMLVGGLAVIVVIIFWAQSVLVRSLQQSATVPIPETAPSAPTSTASAGSANTQGSQAQTQAPATKKTTITKPVKHHH